MADTRGTWSLSEAWAEKASAEWVPLPNVWIGENQNVGYVKFYNQFQYKINFSTEVSTVTTHLPTARFGSAATSSATAAYFIGGEPGPRVSDAIKITYASDTSADTPSARFHIPINAAGALAGKDHSYLFGGIPSGSTYANKLTFATDTTVNSPSSYLEGARYNVQTGTAGGANGYMFAGGTSDYSETQRIAFSNDTRTTLPSSSRMDPINENGSGNGIPYWGAGKMQCSTHCYYGGGNPSGGNYTSTFQKLTFANETWAVNPSKMSRAVRNVGGFTASPTQGAIAGGQTPSGGNGTSSVDFVTFATDVWATSPSMTLPSTPGGTAGAYNNQVSSTTIHDSMHGGTPGLSLINERFVDGASEDAPANNGYFVYGQSNGNPGSYVDKANFTTDTLSASTKLGGNKSQSHVGTGDRKSGYISGNTPSGQPGAEKINFTTDATSYAPGCNSLPAGSGAYTNGAATSTRTHIYQDLGVYWIGFNKITTSTDTNELLSTTAYATPGQQSREFSAAVGNPSAGYFIGGSIWNTPSPSYSPGYSDSGATDSRLYKFTYSSDTGSIVPGSNINRTSNQGIELHYATESSTAGYVIGGRSSSTPSFMSEFKKFTFATETASSLPGPSVSMPSADVSGATTASSAAYFGKYQESRQFKFTYASETGGWTPNMEYTAWPARPYRSRSHCSPSDCHIPINIPPTATPTASTFGVPVNFGLRVMYNGSYTNIGKLDFTTDSTSKLTDQPAVLTAGDEAGGWNDNSGGKMIYGTQAGGSNIFGLPYTTGTVSTISTAPISPGENTALNKAWTYSTTHGFFSGGRSYTPSYPSHHTNTTRYTFSTDTVQTSYPSQRLVHAVERARGVANSTHGYVTGGGTDNPGASDRSYVQKASFSTGDFAQVPSANLNAITTGHGITGNSTSARIAGKTTYSGQSDESRFQKLTYSNDTTTTLPGSTLPGTPSSSHGRGVAATGNQTQGYFGGSTNISPITNVKIVYATDTTSETPAWANHGDTRDTIAKSAGEQNGSGKAPSPNLI